MEHDPTTQHFWSFSCVFVIFLALEVVSVVCRVAHRERRNDGPTLHPDRNSREYRVRIHRPLNQTSAFTLRRLFSLFLLSSSCCLCPIRQAKRLLGQIVDRCRNGPGFHSQMDGNSAVQEILIPASKVGLVIGKGGDTIKHLQVSFISRPDFWTVTIGTNRCYPCLSAVGQGTIGPPLNSYDWLS